MKNVKISLLVVILVVLSSTAIGIAANANIAKNDEGKINQQTMFDAEITFYIHEGEGCGCVPIVGAHVYASGGAGYDEAYTDEDGMCALTLEILSEYRVSINAEDFMPVLFDFDVQGDQTFGFHMQERITDRNTMPVLFRLLLNIFQR